MLTKTEHKSSIQTSKNESLVNNDWHIYIIETRLGHWYTGITTDVTRRFNEHEKGFGAKNLRGKGPLSLIFHIKVGNRSQASILEYQVKKLSKIKKRAWVLEMKNNIEMHQS
ncbi:GIY-YIG nuclease family protein [Pseudoalteromonas denitrificans]|uniref:GIY-YIG nuclease family protein n=1 Tax=Pseudoalteromonas denitrificans TaxID=43656 RepID=UPI003CCC3024